MTQRLQTRCINPKAILQLPGELRTKFIDLLMAFEAKLVKPLCRAHMMVLRPKPSGGHHTIGLTVFPSRVLSSLRWPLAQKWEKEHDAAYFWSCQGKACDLAGVGALDRGGGSKGSRRRRCFWMWPNSTSTSGTIISGGGRQDKFPKATAGLLVRFLRKAGGVSKQTSVLFFPSGPSGPFSQAAVAPPRQPN